MATANVAFAAEKLVGTYGEQRTVLAFKVPDTAAQTLLPEGWKVSPPSTGPSKDANLNVVFVDVRPISTLDSIAKLAIRTHRSAGFGCGTGWRRLAIDFGRINQWRQCRPAV